MSKRRNKNSLVLTIDESPKGEVERLTSIFERTGCSVSAMQGFVSAYNAGEPIPASIQRWIARSFTLWATESEPIEKSLGLRGARGQAPQWQQTRTAIQKEFALIEMSHAIRAFQTSAEYAAYMVECKRKAECDAGRLTERYVYTTDTLIRYWYASTNMHKPGKEDRDEEIAIWGEVINDWEDPEFRRKYQREFPRHCWPSEK